VFEMKKYCLECKKEINHGRPSWIKRAKFCSISCKFVDFKYGSFKKGCAPTRTSFKKGNILSEETKKKLSIAGKGKNTWTKGLKFGPMVLEHRKKIGQAQLGNKHWNWQGGRSSINEIIRHSFEYKQWRTNVFQRDEFICQICDTKGGELRGNHIKKFADYPELRFELTNGITICKSCDLTMVMYHEPEWESYFNFNLMNRGLL